MPERERASQCCLQEGQAVINRQEHPGKSAPPIPPQGAQMRRRRRRIFCQPALSGCTWCGGCRLLCQKRAATNSHQLGGGRRASAVLWRSLALVAPPAAPFATAALPAKQQHRRSCEARHRSAIPGAHHLIAHLSSTPRLDLTYLCCPRAEKWKPANGLKNGQMLDGESPHAAPPPSVPAPPSRTIPPKYSPP